MTLKRLDPHLCSNCYITNGGYVTINHEQKKCLECGGTVLNLVEASDALAERDSELRSLKEIYGE